MSIILRPYPKFEVIAGRRTVDLEGRVADLLLAFLYDVGYYGTVTVHVCKPRTREERNTMGLFFSNCNLIRIFTPDLAVVSPITLAHETFHLASYNNPAKVKAWLVNMGVKIPETLEDCRRVLDWRFAEYDAQLKGKGKLAKLIEEACALTFENYARD